MGRYRLAGTGYVRLEIAPCPGSHISAVRAVGWNLNWEKLVNCSQYTVGRGINRRFICPEKKIKMVFLIPQFCSLESNRESINAQNIDINGRSLRGFIMIRARFQNIQWVLFSLLCGYNFLLFKTIPNYSKK